MDSTPRPTGTVTFLFTDIEGSTQLWEQHPDAMRLALARHDACLSAAIESNHGYVFKTVGDAFCAAFATAADALDAALAAQQNLRALQPSAVASAATLSLKVRIALHTGAAEARGGDYFGPALNRISRLLSIGHGGQVLLSRTTYELVQEELPPQVCLRALGSHRLRDLQRPEQVYQVLHPELPADFPPLKSLDALPNNLPRQLNRFIGREPQIAEVKRLLSSSALLTLTGAGGCGKTRLALQVAADLLEEYADGVWLVELAALSDPSLVPQTVASTLGVREAASCPLIQALIDHLRPKQLLLLLDNCEHVLDACARLAETLLRVCPQLRILASSREALGLMGEQAYRVPSLSLPDPRQHSLPEGLQEFEAVQLFVDRAALSQATFAVTAANAAAVAQICQRLDGIPLAIELAAARVRALPVEKINERLDDMFRLLTGGSGTALPRQQTLRALIDWSYDLLSPSERALFRRLSVFAGGWTLESAEAVCAGEGVEAWEVLDLLTSLVEKSLVLYEEGGGEARYRLLETVRQYARDRLLEAGEAATARNRHRDWFLTLAEQAEPALLRKSQGPWMDRLEQEHDNLRAALAWSEAEGQVEAGLRLGGALARFWEVRDLQGEGKQHLTALLSMPGARARTTARAKALHGAGLLTWHWGDPEGGRALLEESLGIYRELGDRTGVAFLLGWLGIVLQAQGEDTASLALLEEGLAISREIGNTESAALALGGLAAAAIARGDYERARALYAESLELQRALGNTRGIAWALNGLGRVAHAQGEYGTACSLLEESLAIFEELGFKQGAARSFVCLADLSRDQGNHGAEWTFWQKALAIMRDLGHKPSITKAVERLAAVAVAQAEWERAARLFGAVEGWKSMDHPLSPVDQHERDCSVAAVRAVLGEEAFASAWEEGRAMSLDEAVAFALKDAVDA